MDPINIILFIISLTKRKLEKNDKIKRVLIKYGLIELKPDFDSVYCRTLIEYGIDKNPPELCYLFAEHEVKEAFKIEIYDKKVEEFNRTAEKELHTSLNNKIRKLKISFELCKLAEEIKEFKDKFIEITNTTRSPKELELYNKLTKVEINFMKQTFVYQSEEYMKYLINDFENKYLKKKLLYQTKRWDKKNNRRW